MSCFYPNIRTVVLVMKCGNGTFCVHLSLMTCSIMHIILFEVCTVTLLLFMHDYTHICITRNALLNDVVNTFIVVKVFIWRKYYYTHPVIHKFPLTMKK